MNLFIKKCKELNQVSDKLYSDADRLAEKLLTLDLSDLLDQNVVTGLNVINGEDDVKEIRIEANVFNFMNKEKSAYKAYKLHFEKEFSFLYLGFKYKGEVVSPHIIGEELKLIDKYSEIELDEIIIEIDKRTVSIVEDIDYISKIQNYRDVKFHYRNYDGLFDGEYKFDNLNDTRKDFNKLL